MVQVGDFIHSRYTAYLATIKLFSSYILNDLTIDLVLLNWVIRQIRVRYLYIENGICHSISSNIYYVIIYVDLSLTESIL